MITKSSILRGVLDHSFVPMRVLVERITRTVMMVVMMKITWPSFSSVSAGFHLMEDFVVVVMAGDGACRRP